MLWLPLLAIPFILASMHQRTAGRSSPVAALGFVLGGPVLGALLPIPAAIKEARSNAVMAPRAPSEGLYGLSFEEYFLVMFAVGLVAALIAASLYTVTIRDELLQLKEERTSPRPRPVASPALHALGLNAFASLEDVECAYRQRAMEAHPDRGGDEAKFKRLQQHYEQAKRYVRRSGGDER